MEGQQFLCSHHMLMTAALFIYFLTLCLQGVSSCNQRASDCVEGHTFLNSSGCCEPCRTCNQGRMFNKTKCNVTHNTQCECHRPLYFDARPEINRCVVNCRWCPITGMCIRGASPERCDCGSNRSCYKDHDFYCEDGPVKCSVSVIGPNDGSAEATESKKPVVAETFPTWGIGLIAIGVVIGIIIFASCFLCLGLVTISRRRDPESQGSETSESGLVRSSFSSIGTESSFLSTGYPYLTSHSMLELLKNSNPQLLTPASTSSLGHEGPVSNSQRSSPISSRDSPRPVRTIKLVKHSDKLSAVVL